MNAPPIDGRCDARFASIRDVFAENFRERGELGAAVAVTIDGRPVVDLWGGFTDNSRSRGWDADTLVNVFSVGKAMASVCLLRLVDRGVVDLDAPVSRYWPEFAAAGKDGVCVRAILAHRAGLPALRQLLPEGAMYDWALMTESLAAEAPWWEPGERHGYHVNTFGFLVGEIVRRVTGCSIGSFFRDEVAGPLQADFHFGVGPQYDARIADYYYSESMLGSEPARAAGTADSAADAEAAQAKRYRLHRVYLNPAGLSGLGTVNTREWRACEMPSTNGHSNARSLARLFTPLACGGSIDGVSVLNNATIEAAIAEASSGLDAVLDRPSRFGLGFQLAQPERGFGAGKRNFGHFGAGGAVGFADPDARLAFGYTMNQAGPRFNNPCAQALMDAVYQALQA